MHQHLLKHQTVWAAYSEGQFSPADMQMLWYRPPWMHWWKRSHMNPLQTQRAFIGIIDWTQDTFMTFPRQERLGFKTFPFYSPSPENNLGISKALDLAEQTYVINTKVLICLQTNVFIYMRLPVLIHEEGGVKVWNFRLSLNRHIISFPFPFSLHVSPLTHSSCHVLHSCSNTGL